LAVDGAYSWSVMILSKFAFTAAALKGSPSWNFTSLRRVKVYTRPSGERSHFSASHGWIDSS
jgi:hypothetical protein